MSNNVAPLDGPYLLNSIDADIPNSVVWPGVFISGSSAPSDTRYGWFNTGDSSPYYYNPSTSSWVKLVSTQTITYDIWTPLTATFIAGAQGATDLTVDLGSRSWLPIGSYVLITDDTLVNATYKVTAYSSDVAHPRGVVLTRQDSNGASTSYSFTVANNARLIIGGAYGGSGGGGSSLTVTDGTTSYASTTTLKVLDTSLSSPTTGTVVIPTINEYSTTLETSLIALGESSTTTSSNSDLILTFNKFGLVSKITSDTDCILRLYQTSSARSQDLSREFGTKPRPGISLIIGDICLVAGVTLEASFSSWINSNNKTLYMTVINQSSDATTITLTVENIN